MTDPNPFVMGLAGIGALLALLACSMPVAFSMAVVGGVGLLALYGNATPVLSLVADTLHGKFADYNLTVIPLFIFMGQMTFHTGMSAKLFRAAYCWMGWVRGGLAMATVGACAAFGTICGSGPATAATMAAVALPEMRRFKYGDALAAGVVASGGGLGMMIPPSVVFIVYGILTQESIGRLFIAGIVPGLLCAFLFCAVIAVWCRADPGVAPGVARVSWRERLASLRGVWQILALFALVMGGMFAGFFSPTEGAAVGAAGSVAVGAMGRTFRWRDVWRATGETVRMSCMVMVIVTGAEIFGKFLGVTELPMRLAEWLAALHMPRMAVVALAMLFYLGAGCFIDALALILLTLPIFNPVMKQLGIDPVWFGVMIVLVVQMGVITPPVGVNVYVVNGVERGIPLQTVFRGSMPFLFALVAAAALLMLFPGLATWLPNLAH